jgi:alpha-tubulin suppressor-like RCC1 family protein
LTNATYPEKTICLDRDTDTDGIPNRLDLDSDADGCSDAYEAGTTTNTSANFAHPISGVGTNGFANSLEATADNGSYNGTYNSLYVIDKLTKACLDSDGDSIADVVDLDDDNDGVLDAEECESPFFDNWTDLASYKSKMLSSAFHGTLLRSKSGKYYVVGQYASATGTDITIPTLITPANGYNYTGEVIDMAAVGSNSSYALATTEGIWVWGYLSTNFKLPGVSSSTASPFQKVTLPSEIDPKNIKSISASTNNFIILLNDGTVYAYGKDSAPLNGAGLTTATAAFTKVLVAPNTPLTNIAQIEATSDGSFAADVTNNKLYTWGTNVYLGNGSAFSTKNYASEMTNPLPNGVGIAMIDATYSTSMTYLLLGTDKKVYSMGSGAAGILGQNSTTNLTTWSNVKGKDGVGVLENVEYLSAQNSTDGFPAASVILNTGQPLSWGDAGGSQMLGLGNASTLVPKTPDGITPTEIIYVLENGGHLTPMLNDKGEIGNVGHNVSGSFADGSTSNRSVYVFNAFERGTDLSDNLAATCNPDIDGDGIPNRLDLDTDGDGCSDAKEAGVSGTLLSGTLVNKVNGSLTNTTVNNALAQGAFGTNGLADGVETSADSGLINYSSTYVNYAKSATVNVCDDFDSDGIPDIMDIDDDNDGILDAIESPNCYLPATFFASGDRRTSFTVTSEVERVSPANQPKTLIDGDETTTAIGFVNNATIVNKELYKIMFNYPVPLSQLILRFADGNSHFNSGAIVKVQGSNDNNTWTDLNTGTTFNTVADNTIVAPFWTVNTPNEIFTVTQNQGRYKFYRLYGTAGTVRSSGYATEFYFTTATTYEPSFYPKTTCIATDTDNDGIANNFDLDSDGDGCPDAKEAGIKGTLEAGSITNRVNAVLTTTPNVASAVAAGPYGLNGYANGVETAAETAIYNGTFIYKYALATYYNGCIDSDNDNVGDLYDLDDDNDGVLDTQECAPFDPNNVNYAPRSFTVTNGASASQTFPAAPNGLVVNVWSLDNSFNVRINGTHLVNPEELEFFTTVTTNSVVEFLDGTSYTSVWEIAGNQQRPLFRIYIDQFGDSRIFGTRTSYGPLEEMRLRTGSFNKITLNTNTTNTFQIGQDVKGQTFISGDYGVIIPADCDADNDGIPNGLDLDSDGDGCSDAKEAGVVGTLNTGSIVNLATGSTTTTSTTANVSNTIANGPYGVNGFADALETTGNGNYTNLYSYYYAVNSTLNSCLDSDTDGVIDIVDIDDDNDGILDAVESSACFSTTTEASIPSKLTSELLIHSTNIVINAIDNNSSTYSAFATGQNWVGKEIFRITPSVVGPIAISGVQMDLFNWALSATSTSTFKLQGSVDNGTTWADLSAAVSSTATTGLFTVSNTLNPSVKYSLFRIVGVAGTCSYGGVYELRLVLPSTYQASQYPKATCNVDTDADGIFNHLDLDSDGDGCPDANEAKVTGTLNPGSIVNLATGSTTTTTTTANVANTIANGPYGINGFANALQTSGNGVYASLYSYHYAINRTVNTCLDSDNDGVNDIFDVDDDNDGVLDAVESPTCFYSNAEASLPTTISTELSLYSTNTITNAIDANASTYSAFNTGQNWVGKELFRITPSMIDPIAISGVQMDLVNWALSASTANTFKLQGSVDNGVTWVDLSAAVSSTATTGSFTVSNTLNPTVKYNQFRIIGVAGSCGYSGVTELRLVLPTSYHASLYPKMSCTTDTDNDGKLNHLDLDSDGDGCSDAKEAGTTTSATTNYAHSAPHGINGFADALETTAESGSYNGTYSYSFATTNTVNACIDTDSDGVGDIIDLDDDNDGVLDRTECTPKPASILFAGSNEDFNTMRSSLFAEFNKNKATGATIVQSNIIETATVPAGFYDGYDMVIFGGAAFNTIHANHWAALQTAIQNKASKAFIIQSDNCCVAANRNGLVSLLNNVFGSDYTVSTSNPTATQAYSLNTLNSYGNLFTTSSLSGANYFPILNVPSSDVLFYSPSVSGSAVAGMKQLPGTADQSRFLAWFVDGTITQGAPWYTSNENKIAKAFFDVYGSTAPMNCDTDGDGILNHLDLDSDGDNCSDAKEAGTTTSATINYAHPAPHGTNGFANALETTVDNGVYNGTYTYNVATSNALNGCLDTDNDGVGNLFDLDDDNDGVLDTVEENCSIITTSKTGLIITKPATINYSYNSNAITNLIDGVDNNVYVAHTPTGTLSNSPWFNFEFPTPKALTYLEIGHYSGQYLFSLSSTYKIQGSSDNTNWTDVTGTLTYNNIATATSGGLSSNNSNIANFESNRTAYKYYRIYGISGAAGAGWATEIYFKEAYCVTDIDNDGIPNSLDLDSDGDGCSDAKEAGSSTTAISTSLYPTGTDNNRNGLLNNYEGITAGTISYTSTYTSYGLNANLNACVDTDSDGVGDLIDLDDDNDGVLDVVECPQSTPYKVYTHNRVDATFAQNVPVIISGITTQTVALDQRTQGVAPNNFTANGLSSWKLVASDISPNAQNKISVKIAPNISTLGTYTSADAMLITNGVNTYVIDNTSSVIGEFTTKGTWIPQSTAGSYLNNSNQYFQSPFTSLPTATWTFSTAACIDTDNDGTPNYKDLDSDGDGCSDAKEAGSSTTATSTSVYPTGTDDNTNGLLNDYEGTTAGTTNYTSTYANYALVNSLNVCLDTDGDGKGDIIDIDDDNDGVLDVNEYNCEVSTMSKTGVTVSSTVTWGYNSTTLNNLVDGAENLVVYPNGEFLNETIFQFNLPSAKVLEQIEVSTQSGLTTLGTTGTYNLEGWNGTAWVVIERNKTFGGTSAPIRAPGNTYKFYMPNNLTAYTKYRIFGTSIKGTYNSSSWIQEAYFYERSCNIDVDNDGVANWLDSDTDGDGCPDAVEVGTTAISTSGVANNAKLSASTIPAPYSPNGFATGLETTAGNGVYKGTYDYSMAADASVNACTDTDNDGIVDALDLDDDNDGVLDVTELNCATSIVSKTGITVSSTVTWGYNSGTTLANLVNGSEDLAAYTTTDFIDQTILQFDFPVAKTLSLIEISTQNSGTTLGTTAKYNVQGWNGSKWINILTNQTFAITAPVLASANSYTIKMPSNTSAFTKYRIFGMSTKGTISTTTWIQEVYFTEQSCNLDTDGDGRPNTQDTDSDGDGCSDAVEAGTVTGTSATTVAGTYGANGFVNSLETATESGIYSGTYSYQFATDATFSSCRDTDGDGVMDVNDIDDDNDGILDTIECPSSQMITNGDFSNGTTGWTVGSGWTLESGTMANYLDGVTNSMLSQTIGRPYPTTRPGYIDFNVDVRASGYNNIQANAYTASLIMQVNGIKYAVLTNPGGNSTATIQTFNGAVSSISTFPVQLLSGPLTTVTISIPNSVFFANNQVGIGFTAGNDDFTIDNVSLTTSPSLAACDTDGDGVPNSRDIDSDGDGCSDANEAYNSATAQGTDGNSYYGTGNPPAVDASGKVTGASYAGTNANVTTAGTVSVITVQPADAGVSPGDATSFTATVTAGSAPVAYQWQLSTDGGTTWTNVTNSAPYSGATTTTLAIANVTMSMKGYSYKLVITQANFVCGTVISNPAKIEITPFVSVVDDAITAAEDTVVTGNVLTNDTGSGNTALTLNTFKIGATTYNAGQTATIVGVGTIQVNANGTFTFTPQLNYIGTVPAIEYTATDRVGASDSGTLSIIITPTNDPPGATDELVNVTEDIPFTGDVLSNDTDAEGNSLVVSTFSTTINNVVVTFNAGATASIPGVGTIVVNTNGSFTFTPALNYIGIVPDVNYIISDGNGGSDIAKLSIVINPVNDAPLSADDIVVTPEDIPISGNVLTNDTDLEGNNLSVTQFTINGTNYPAGTTTTITNVGTIIVNSNGSFTFTPVLDYTGNVPDISYTVSDGNTTDTGILDLFVAPVNDSPVANIDTNTINEDSPATGNVLTNDTDTDTPLASLVVTEITFNAGGTNYTYPAGTTVTIPGVGTVIVNTNGTYTFTPNSNWNGTVPVITYTVSDGEGGRDTETLALIVTPINDNPITVNDDNKVTPEDTPISGNVLDNDSDPEGTTITVTQFTITGISGVFNAGTTPATIDGVGTLIIGTNGSFTFTPAANYSGAVPTVTYTARDVDGGTGTATLKLAVTPVNDAPVAVDDTVSTPENTAATGNVVTNDTDVEGNTKSVTSFSINGITYQVGTIVTIPGEGNLLLNADGTYTFTPDAGSFGVVPTISYTISDGNGGTDIADLIITVTAVNDAPVVINDSLSTNEDTPCSGNVLTNDRDPENNTLTITGFNVGGQTYTPGQTATITGVGTIQVNANGTFTFTPVANYNGSVPVIGYTVSDGQNPALTTDGSLSINVTPVNDAPTARNNSESILINTTANGNVLTNDTDADGNTLTVTGYTITGVTGPFTIGTIETIPNVGTLVINADGTYIFTPDSNYFGPVPAATYTVSDGTITATATLTINVTAPDTDGDGVYDYKEIADATDPNNLCNYLPASVMGTRTGAWNLADCDGDGTPNGSDTAPLDPCVHAVNAQPDRTNIIWQAADCDQDGETNGDEITNGTNPNNACSYTSAPLASSSVYSTWSALDCDNDGLTNGAEVSGGTNPLNPDTDGDGNPDNTDTRKTTPTATNDTANAFVGIATVVNILTNDDYLANDGNSIIQIGGTALGT